MTTHQRYCDRCLKQVDWIQQVEITIKGYWPFYKAQLPTFLGGMPEGYAESRYTRFDFCRDCWKRLHEQFLRRQHDRV
jgi:hypothetical protein